MLCNHTLQQPNESIGIKAMKLTSGKNLDFLALGGGILTSVLGIGMLKHDKILGGMTIAVGVITFMIHFSHLRFMPQVYHIDAIVNTCKMQHTIAEDIRKCIVDELTKV